MGFCPKDQKSLETGEQTQVTQVRVSDCSLRLLATVPCCLAVVLTLPNHVQADRQKPLKSQPSHPELRPFPKRVWQEGLGSVSRGSASLLPCPFQDTTATQWRPISNKG